MKNIIVIIIVAISLSCSNTKLCAQQLAPTDTLGWLKTNIEQRSNLFVGKPLSVLLDSLYNLNDAIGEYERSFVSDGQSMLTYPTDTVWTNKFRVYFGKYLDDRVWLTHRDNINANTHVPYIYLEFTQKIPFPSALQNDKNTMFLFGPVRDLCSSYIVASIKVGEW